MGNCFAPFLFCCDDHLEVGIESNSVGGGEAHASATSYRRLSESKESTSEAVGVVANKRRTTVLSEPTLRLSPHSLEDERQYMRRRFSQATSAQMEAQRECVLCLEPFSADNPEIPTLCNCGVNRHSYHLSCLEEWRAKSRNRNCAFCNAELYFEDPSLTGESTSGDNNALSTTVRSLEFTAAIDSGDELSDF